MQNDWVTAKLNVSFLYTNAYNIRLHSCKIEVFGFNFPFLHQTDKPLSVIVAFKNKIRCN